MPLSFFPHYSLANINERIKVLACYASGVYTSQNSDSYTFLDVSNGIIKDYNNGKLWQQWLIKALTKVNR